MATEIPVSPVDTRVDPPAAPPPAPPRRRRRTWLWLLLLGLAGFGVYRIYENLQQSKQKAAAAQTKAGAPRAAQVVTTPARTGDVPVYLRGLGNVAPFNNVVVRSRVDGQLMSVHFNEGQFVRKGELLAEIDPRPFEVQLQQAEGQLARDQAQLNDAQTNLARYESLWRQQIIAKQQLDTVRSQVGQFEGAIQSDRATINNAKLQLTYAKVTAPLSGRVGLRQVDVGNIIRASDANGLVTIAQLQPIAVFFTIPADDLPPVLRKLRAGAKLPVYAYDKDDVNKIATGVLLTVDNQIDPQTGTSRLKAEFANADLSLFPNQFVNCRMLLETRHGLTLIPSQAVQRGPQGSFVFIADNGVARMRPIEVQLTEAGDTAVSGVRPGELVVIEGQDKLVDGAKIDSRAGGGRGNRGKGSWGARGGQGGAGTDAGQGGRGAGFAGAPPTSGAGPAGPQGAVPPGGNGGMGSQATPGNAAPNGPNQNFGPAPARGWGQGREWKGPGQGARPPRGQGEGRTNR